jgi:hypothetical protein
MTGDSSYPPELWQLPDGGGAAVGRVATVRDGGTAAGGHAVTIDGGTADAAGHLTRTGN